MWTGGSAPSPLLQASGLADGPGNWVSVNASLQSRRFDNVFVAGDAAALPRPLGKQAYYAMQMGECAANNVVRALEGRRLRNFSPSRKPMLVAFGDLDTFLVSGNFAGGVPGARGSQGSHLPGDDGAIRSVVRRRGGAQGRLPSWCAQRKNLPCPRSPPGRVERALRFPHDPFERLEEPRPVLR